jgi:hypothetical protein
LSLDALSSVAYGPEAIVLVLVAAGVGALIDAKRVQQRRPVCAQGADPLDFSRRGRTLSHFC